MSPDMGAVLAGLRAEEVGPRCLVTGGAGYLGRRLVAALLELGCEVRSLDRVPPPEPRPGVEEITADLREAEAVRRACEGVDVVFHTAARMCLLGVASPALREEVFAINLGGTQKVISACRLAGVGRLVYTSSANVAIDRELVEADESVGYAREFVDLYGESKVAAERAALAADEEGGLRTAALRPGGIWGPGEGGLMIRSFLEQLLAGRFEAVIGDGEAVVDNTHVDSLVRAELLAAARLRSAPEVVGGRAYFITDDERINGVEWFRPLVEGLGYRMPDRRIPGGLMYGLAGLMEHAHALGAPEPPVTRIGVLKLTRSSAFRIDRAREELGYAPLLGRDEGLRRHLPGYREAALRPELCLREEVPEGWAARDAEGRDKLVFVLRERRRERGPGERRAILLRTLAPALRDEGAASVSLCIQDEEADPVPSPNPLAPRRAAGLVSVWIGADTSERCHALLEGAGFSVEGYRVAESLYTDYGGNRHAGPRSWPSGARSPGVTAVSLLRRPGHLSRAEWLARWQGRMSPVSERLQPRARYVRNLVLARLRLDAPRIEGIVEESWPSIAHVRDPYLFYGAEGPLELARNMAAIFGAVSSFLRIWEIETSMMGEYLP